jgi:hypothetical protein
MAPSHSAARVMVATRTPEAAASACVVDSEPRPAQSSTASTPSGAIFSTCSTSSSPYTTGSAHNDSMNAWLAGEPVPITRAPRATAIWTARCPTPPAAPCTRTVSPTATFRLCTIPW